MKVLAEIEEIKKVIPMMELKWSIQNDKSDDDTNFIYYCQRLDQVVSLAISNEIDIGYALHRWYNYQCSKWCEQMFCENGAQPYENEKDHDIDILIDEIPFDIKLSIISPFYTGNRDLANRKAKDDYIKWLKANASQEKRKHDANKIFIIVDDIKSKCDIFSICDKIIKFVEYFKKNKTKYEGNGICELIYVPSSKDNYGKE